MPTTYNNAHACETTGPLIVARHSSHARALPFLDNPPPTVPIDMPKHTGRHALRPPGSVVKTLARPEIDTKRLARLLMQLAQDDLDRQRNRKDE
jgi:hypothetical protein